MRGNAALASGAPADALARYREAAAADPFLDAAIFGQGLAAYAAGDLVQSARAFASIVRTDPRARDEFRRVADELAARASALDVLTVLEAFLAVDPDDGARKAAYDAARRRVLEALESAIEGPGGFDAQDRVRRARLFLRLGEPGRALAEAERAAAKGATVTALRGDCLLARKEPYNAWLDYSRAARDAPDDPEPLIGIARILLARDSVWPAGGERPEAAAEAYLTRASRLVPERADVLRLRAEARLALGKLPEARADAERAVAIERRHADGYALLAAIALKEEKREEARAFAERANRLGPVRDPALQALLDAPR
jgi:tetratricopeptide (TPR) repeat protein